VLRKASSKFIEWTDDLEARRGGATAITAGNLLACRGKKSADYSRHATSNKRFPRAKSIRRSRGLERHPFQTGDFGFLLFTQIEGRSCTMIRTLSNIGATLFSGYPLRVSLPRTLGWRKAACVTLDSLSLSLSLSLSVPLSSAIVFLVSAIRERECTSKRNVLLSQLNVSGPLRRGNNRDPQFRLPAD